MVNMSVIELRNYLLKPGMRDRFNGYFTEHFVDSQNSRGAHVLGKYAVEGEADKFFWIRGFEDMKTRSVFLPEFYGGPVWKEFGKDANEMMIDSDDVHLLKPLDGSQVFKPGKIVRVDNYFAKDRTPERLIEIFRSRPEQNGASLWISELAENDFPALPVFQYENLLVAINPLSGDDGARAPDPELLDQLGPFILNKERLLLYEI
jgi:hypothetical protein